MLTFYWELLYGMKPLIFPVYVFNVAELFRHKSVRAKDGELIAEIKKWSKKVFLSRDFCWLGWDVLSNHFTKISFVEAFVGRALGATIMWRFNKISSKDASRVLIRFCWSFRGKGAGRHCYVSVAWTKSRQNAPGAFCQAFLKLAIKAVRKDIHMYVIANI